MTALVHWLMSRFGPLVSKRERDEALVAAFEFQRDNVRLQADLDFAYTANADLAMALAIRDHELSRLRGEAN